MESFQKLIDRADKIPDLGLGGKAVKEFLIYAASNVRKGQAIVELGPWLGSATAYMSIGVHKAKSGVPIYSYDRWNIDSAYKRKAETHNEIKFAMGKDILPNYKRYTKGFGAKVIPNKIDVIDVTWHGQPIGLFVDDIATGKQRTDKVLDTFMPSFVPYETVIIFMDYAFMTTKVEGFLKYQHNLVKANPKVFSPIGRIGRRSMAAAFLFTGADEFKKVEGESYRDPEYKKLGLI